MSSNTHRFADFSLARAETSLEHFVFGHRILFIGIVVILYAALVSPNWQIYRDSSLYLLMAESLASGEGYSIFGQPQGKYPPGYSLYLAGMMRNGLGDMLWLNLAMTMIGLLALCFTYGLLRQNTSRRFAFLLACALAMTYEMFRRSSAQLSDVPFLLLVTAGLWCLCDGLQRKRVTLEAGTLLVVGCCWVRVLGIPLALAAAVALLFEPREVGRGRVWCNVVTLVVGVAVTAYWLFDRDRTVQATKFAPTSYSNTLSKASTDTPFDQFVRPVTHWYKGSAALARFFTGQRMPNSVALLIFWLPIGVGALHSFRHRKYLILLPALGYLGAILLFEAPLARYYLPIAPALLLWFAHGLRTMSFTVNGFIVPRNPVPIAAGLFAMLILCNLPKNLKHVYAVHASHFRPGSKRADLVRTAEFLRNEAHRGNEVRFVMNSGANCVAYLSDTYCLPIGKAFAKQCGQADEVYKTLAEQRINYLVLYKEPKRRRPFFEAIRNAIPTWPEYRVVLDDGNIQIYSGRSTTPRATELGRQTAEWYIESCDAQRQHRRPSCARASRKVKDRAA